MRARRVAPFLVVVGFTRDSPCSYIGDDSWGGRSLSSAPRRVVFIVLTAEGPARMLWHRRNLDGIRGSGRRNSAVPSLRRSMLAASALSSAGVLALSASGAQAAAGTIDAGRTALVSVLLGVAAFAVLGVAAMQRARTRADGENASLRHQLADSKAKADRAEALVDADDQRLVAWSAPGEPPAFERRERARRGARKPALARRDLCADARNRPWQLRRGGGSYGRRPGRGALP
jgi:hypothetical protein